MNRLFMIILPFVINLNILTPQVSELLLSYETEAEKEQILSGGYDVIRVTDEYITMHAYQHEIDTLNQHGYNFEIIHSDIAAFYKSRFNSRPDLGSYNGYYTFQEIEDMIDDWIILYPGLVIKESLGNSHMGNDIWAVKISDNPSIDENEPAVLYTGLTHAKEPNGMMAIVHFIDYLLSNYGSNSAVNYLIDERELWFIPVVNPDGYIYNIDTEFLAWRKNAREISGDPENHFG